MVREVWLHLALNPEQWEVGTISVGRSGGKMRGYMSPSLQLKNYQEAVRDELSGQAPLPAGEYELEFFFWRRLDKYRTPSGRMSQRHHADATNMQKALEDALQGVLFDNDRKVRRVTSEIVEQSTDCTPGVVIHAKLYVPERAIEFPYEIECALMGASNVVPLFPSNNDWPPAEGTF